MEVNKPEKKTVVFEVKRSISVDDQPSELKVKLTFDIQKATFKIIAPLTTKQLSQHDDDLNERVLDQLTDMVRQQIKKGLSMRNELLAAQSGTAGMDELPFGEETEQGVDGGKPELGYGSK